MSNFNYSRVNEKYNIVLSQNLVDAIRIQARLILIPFFRTISVTNAENEIGESYPVLTNLAERIINEVYQKGELGLASHEKASGIALAFVKKLQDWQKECLAFYFCTDDEKVESIEEEIPHSFKRDIPEENWDNETGKIIMHSIDEMVSSENQLAYGIISELVHLQDIFSTEDENIWDASSIAYANENFKNYTNSEIKLIPIPIEDDFVYWDKIIIPDENEDEDDEDDEEDDEEEVEENDDDYNPFG